MEFNPLIDAYRQRLEAFHKEIETICALPGGAQKKKISVSPSYQDEVIIPVYRSLAAEMPGYKIKIPNPKTYFPIKGYYRIKVGITTVGGFSTPEGMTSRFILPQCDMPIPPGKEIKSIPPKNWCN